MVRLYRLMPGSILVILLVRLFLGAQVPSATAATPSGTLIVTRMDDPVPNGCAANGCSLREAIIEANLNPSLTVVMIPMTGTIELSIAGAGEDAAATGDLDITTEIQVIGLGAEVTIVDANGIDRVFDVLPLPQNLTPEGSDVLISSLTITGGLVESDTEAVGGGVRVQSGLNRIMQLTDVVVRDNDGSGGTFGLGGGVASQGGNVFIFGSAIVNNSAENAGGIANIDGAMSISNSTISSNTPRGAVGGIINLANTAGVTSTLGMEAVTIAYNVEAAPQGSGAGLDTTVFDGVAQTNLRNVIISNNVGDTQCFNGGVVDSNGYNIASDDSCDISDPSDLPSSDPLLGALILGARTGGGSTYFHNLSNGSPALDSGSTNGTIDQRDNPRPVDLPGIPNTTDGDDRGAVEMAAEPPTAVTVSAWNVAGEAGNPAYWVVGILLGVGALAVVRGRRL